MNKVKQTPEFLEAWNELTKLYEGYTRQQMIDELTDLGKGYYKFENYTTAQLYNMLIKLRAKLEKEATEAVDWEDIEKELAQIYEKEKNSTCQNCGRRLTTVGECPLCDLNDESVLED